MKRTLFALFATVSSLTAAPEPAPYAWKAAAVSASITPGQPVWMAGYASRKGRSEGVRQELKAKTLVIEDATGGRLVVVTLDLVGVPRPLRDAVEKHTTEKHQLPPGSLLINASHTHSGPMIRTYKPRGGKGPERVTSSNIPAEAEQEVLAEVHAYNQSLVDTICANIDKGIASLTPAQLKYSFARCGFSMNRRSPKPDGTFNNFPNPDGPVDQEVPTLQIYDATGENLTSVLFGYACHATTLGDMLIHGDWPGYAQQYFETDHPGSLALFLNGCSGDQNPYPRRKVEYVERHGRAMATAIDAAIFANPTPVNGPVRALLEWTPVAYDTLPDKAELALRQKDKDPYEQRYASFLLDDLEANGSLATSYPVPVQVIRFGDSLTMATLGGEVVVDYSHRLKKELGQKNHHPVWVAGYSNDVMCYLPSKRVVEEGGYEGKTSMRYVRTHIHPTNWSPAIEETLVKKVHQLNDRLEPK
jgi:hypothetical protein